MKKFNLIDVVTLVGIISSILLILMFASGCAMKMKFYEQSPADVRKCCERVSLHQKEMEKFNRYCKVALFLANSEKSKNIGSGVRKGARDAVNVCKFVFGVKTDAELVAAGDEQEYQRVQTFITLPEDEMGLRKTLDCDPQEFSCEEF